MHVFKIKKDRSLKNVLGRTWVFKSKFSYLKQKVRLTCQPFEQFEATLVADLSIACVNLQTCLFRVDLLENVSIYWNNHFPILYKCDSWNNWQSGCEQALVFWAEKASGQAARETRETIRRAKPSLFHF